MNTIRLLILGLLVCVLLTGPLVGLGDEPSGELSGSEGDTGAGVVRVIPPGNTADVPRLSAAADVMRVLPAGDASDGEARSLLARDEMVGMRFRLDRQAAGSEAVGNDTGDTSLNLFWPFEANGDGKFLFMDLSAQVSDQGRGGTSLGMGYRSYNEKLDRIFGLSGWWDWDNSHARTYRQAGASFESLGQFFDFRLNGYFPLADEQHTVHDSTDFSNPYFGGFNVLVDRTRIFESNYRGLDTEVGIPLPVLGRYGARGYMGMYHWSSKNDRDTTGWKARIETQVTDDVMIGVSVSDDSLFGTNTWLNIVLTLPDGRPETFFRPQTMQQRLNGSVRRNHRVVINRRRQVDGVPLMNSSGANAGDPIQLVWVNPNLTNNGTGSYESPLNSLETYNNVPGNDMLIVGSGDLTGSLNLYDDQKLLSEWMLNQQQYNLETPQGLIPLPVVDPLATTKPIFSNPMGVDGNDGGSIVTITGSNTEIGGMHFDGQTSIVDVYANAISSAPGWTIGGFNFHDNEFDDTRNSVLFTNNASSGSEYALGVFEWNTLRGNEFDSTAGFQLTGTDGSLLNLRVANNDVRNYRGEDLDGDGVLDPNEDANDNGVLDPGEDLNGNGLLDPGEDSNGNGELDAGVAFSIVAREGAVINAISIPGDPGLTLGISDNIAMSNGTGLLLLTETGGVINADVSGNTFSNNFDPNTGVSMTADSGGTINLFSFLNNDVSFNHGVGMRMLASGEDLNRNGILDLDELGGTIVSMVNEDRNRNGVLDPTEDSNGNGLLDVGEDLNGNGLLDGAEDLNGNGVLDHGFTGNWLIGNDGDGLVVMVNDGSILNLNIGSPSDLLPGDKLFGLLEEVDANADGILNHGNGNGLLDPGEDVNGNGVLDAGEDDNEDRNYNGIRDMAEHRFIGALPREDLNEDGVLNLGNGNGVLDPGEDVNDNGVLDLGEDFDEDFNGNGLLDGPDNVITGNGVTLTDGGSGIVLLTMPTEDLNNNGTLEDGEDINGNGRLDLGGGVITAGLVNTFLDSTLVNPAGATYLENNSGSQLSIVADGGSLGTGSITLSSIANNSMTGAGLDSITIKSNNTGSVVISEIKNSTLDNNVRNGITVESNTGRVDLLRVDSSTFNRVYNGVNGIQVESTNGVIFGSVTQSRFLADPVNNVREDLNDDGVLDPGEDINGNGLLESGAGIGIVVRATGGTADLEIGQTDLGNLFDQNDGAAIEYTLIEGAQGHVAIRDNRILGTVSEDTNGDGVLDPGEDLNENGRLELGDGILVRLVGDLQPGIGNSSLSDSIIDNNIIGALDPSEDLNDNGLLDPGEDTNSNGILDLSLVNEGHGIRFDIQEQSTVSNVWIGEVDDGSDEDSMTGNIIVNNTLDGIYIESLDDALIDGLIISNNLIEDNGLNQAFTDRQSARGNGISIAARDGAGTLGSITAQLNEIRGNQFNGVKVLIDGDARVKFDMFRNIVEANGVGDPDGASFTAGILTLENFNDSTDKRELVGVWHANQIITNNGYGIRFDSTATSLYNLDEPETYENDMQILGNLIDGNGLDGIEFNGMGRLLIDSNDITNNGFNRILAGNVNDDDGNGIDIQAVLLTATGAVEDQLLVEPEDAEVIQAASRKVVHIYRNNVRDNALDGLEIRHANNVSQYHGNNSIYAPLHPGHYPLEVVVRENTFENNGGRGIDILNQGGHRSPRPEDYEDTGEDLAGQFSPTDTFIRLMNNQIRSNDKEGIYVVNSSALSQLQTGNTPTPGAPDDPSRGMVIADDDDEDGRPGDDAVPRLVMEVHENHLFDNGQLLENDRETGAAIAHLASSGLVIRVGTADFARGLSSHASSPVGGPLFEETGFFNRDQPGGVIAKVSSNEFGSNFGSDVFIESFVSTDPDHDLNPVARLDMIFENNEGEALKVTNNGAWYDGPDGIRSNAQNLPLDLDLGGFETPVYGYIVGVHTSSVEGGPAAGDNPTKTSFDGHDDLDTRSSIYNGHELEFTGGDHAGEWRFITAYSAANRRITVSPAYSTAPEIGDGFQIELSTEGWFDGALLDADPRENRNAQVVRDGPPTDLMMGAGVLIKFLDGPLDGKIATIANNFQIVNGNAHDTEDHNPSEFHFAKGLANIPYDNSPSQPGGAVKSGLHNTFIGTGIGSNQTLEMEISLPLPPRDGDLFLLSAVLPGQGQSAFRVTGAEIYGGLGVETNNFDVHDLGFEHKVSLETTLPIGDELPFEWNLMQNLNTDRIRSFFDVLPDLSTVPPTTYKDYLP